MIKRKLIPTPILIFSMALSATICITVAPAIAENLNWFDNYYPYRVEINLDGEYEGKAALNVSANELIKSLADAVPDVVNLDSFNFEKALLVDPASNKVVGGFKIVPESKNLIQHGDFDPLIDMPSSSWKRFNPAQMKIKPIEYAGRKLNALWVTNDTIKNAWVSQPLNLEVRQFYLLRYLVYEDMVNGTMGVAVYNPRKWYFSFHPCSYEKVLQPEKQWTPSLLLYLAPVPEVEVRISAGFIGTGAVTDISLQKVSWKLLVDLSRKTNKLHLYYVPRAGHRFTVPTDKLIADAEAFGNIAEVKSIAPRVQHLNPDGVLVKGDAVEAWTVPSDYPLKVKFLASTKPPESRSETVANINLYRGGAATLLIAVNAGTPLIKFLSAECNAPLDLKFEQVAGIPVYYGSFYDMEHVGEFVETRMDALMPLNDPGIPANENGIHLLAATFSCDESMKSGLYKSSVRLKVQTQVPEIDEIEIPVEMRVLPVVVRAVDHFGTNFGGNHIVRKYKSYGGSLWKESTPPIEYHGFSAPYDKEDIYNLFRTYYNRMIDFCVMPAGLPHSNPFTYTVNDRGDSLAPELTDWDFTNLDKDIDEFIFGRRGRWFIIHGTNGQLMYMLRLIDRITYSYEEAPDSRTRWKKLPEEEYFKLVADYFDAIAKHLHERGCLDKVIYHIDESDPSTYPLMHKYAKALDGREYASKLMLEHTTYKPATWTMRLPNGNLILDEVLDIPAAQNNDLFSYLEPEYHSRMNLPGKIHWVYYTETDHLDLLNAGLSTIVTPLKLRNFGVQGWLCWGSFMWSFPFKKSDTDGPEFPSGQVLNPWLNPFYGHGPGVLNFFYPPDPHGPLDKPTFQTVPSYRLALMRDGIQLHGLLEVLSRGIDDSGRKLKVNKKKLAEAEAELSRLWADNPVQWYLSYGSYRKAKELLYEAVE